MKFKLKDISFNSMQNYAKSYGYELTKSEFVFELAKVALVSGSILTLVYMNLFITLTGVLLSITYYLYAPYRKTIKQKNQRLLFEQRNKFINVSAELFCDPTMKTLRNLEIVEKRLIGAFKEDIQDLVFALKEANKENINRKFKLLKTKYQKDINFVQYIEQLEVIAEYGEISYDTLRLIQNTHNQQLNVREDFTLKKNSHKADYYIINSVVIYFLLGTLVIIRGIESYIIFAHSIVGIISNSLFLILLIRLYISFTKLFFDDDISSLEVS